jgi:hypothetical protein
MKSDAACPPPPPTRRRHARYTLVKGLPHPRKRLQQTDNHVRSWVDVKSVRSRSLTRRAFRSPFRTNVSRTAAGRMQKLELRHVEFKPIFQARAGRYCHPFPGANSPQESYSAGLTAIAGCRDGSIAGRPNHIGRQPTLFHRIIRDGPVQQRHFQSFNCQGCSPGNPCRLPCSPSVDSTTPRSFPRLHERPLCNVITSHRQQV